MPEPVAPFTLALPPLATQVLRSTVSYHACVSSTQDLALAAREDGAVYVADAQTGGRGRRHTPWASAPGRGLWLSVGLAGPPDGLPMAAALAVRDAAAPEAQLEVRWPNDLYLAGGKLAGVLVERRRGHNALGIGLNVLHTAADFPPALRSTATSLAHATGQPWERGALLHRLLVALDVYLVRLRAGGHAAVHAAWAEACDLAGRFITRDGIAGRVVDIAPDGALWVETEAGHRRIDHGAVRVVHDARTTTAQEV